MLQHLKNEKEKLHSQPLVRAESNTQDP